MVYNRPLNVGNTSGERVYAKVFKDVAKGLVTIKLPYIKAVSKAKSKENANLFIGDAICIKVEQTKYVEAIKKLEKFLESAFLKELSDESNNSGNPVKANGGRNKKPSKQTGPGKSKGTNSGTVHNS